MKLPSVAGQPKFLPPPVATLISSQLLCPTSLMNSLPSRLDVEGERIAQPHGVDGAVEPGGLSIKRVVRRNAAIAVEAQDLAEHAGLDLRRARGRIGGAVAGLVIADREIQLAVGPKMNGAAHVPAGGRGRKGGKIDQRDPGGGAGHVPVGGHPDEAVVNRGRLGRVVEVDVSVGGEARIDADAEQAALVLGIRLGAEVDEVGAQESVVLDDLHLPVLLDDQHAAVGKRGQRRRAGEAGGNHGLHEPVRQGGCVLALLDVIVGSGGRLAAREMSQHQDGHDSRYTASPTLRHSTLLLWTRAWVRPDP